MTIRYFLPSALICAVAALAICAAPARAAGTMLVQQRDGSVKIYKGALIRFKPYAMAITSSDGYGMLVVGHAACTQVGGLVRCLPYDATLEQYGDSYHIRIRSGTIWFNPTETAQLLQYSSARLPPRGVLMSFHTKVGTYVSLTGTIDEIQK